MKWKKAVVTGGVGSIGSELVNRMLSEGAEEVMVLDIDEIRLFQLSKTLNDDRLKCLVADIRDPYSIDRALRQMDDIDVIFHAAAMKHVVICEQNPFEASLTNVMGTQRIVDAAIKKNVPACVLVSTDKAADPINVLGATKLIAEKIFLSAARKSLDNTFSIVRFGNVANSRGSVIPVLVDSLLHKKEIIITNPEVTRFMMRIQDAAGLIFKSLEVTIGGEIFVLKMQAFKLGDLADVLVNYAAPQLGMAPSEITLKTTELVRGEKKHERLFADDELNSVADLGDLFAIVDEKVFPKHKKYSKCKKPSLISSDQARVVTNDFLKEIVSDYLTALLGAGRNRWQENKI
jgi:UDP-N-acetylglucosamine 4,6-dehydratase